MKRLLALLVLAAFLLTACAPIDEENFPTAPKITGPTEPWEATVPLPTDQEGNFAELD